MENKMFCYQCEQTAGCAGCTGKAGVCGKTAETARLQDELTGALIGLARAVNGDEEAVEKVWKTVIEGLFTTVTNVSFDDDSIRQMTEKIHRETEKLMPGCTGCGSPCGKNDDYDMNDNGVDDVFDEEPQDVLNEGSAFEMKLITPKSYDDREDIARCLMNGNAVFVNIEALSRDNIIRLMDYLGGVIYVIDGKVKWTNSSSVIFAPKNVNISGIDDADDTDR